MLETSEILEVESIDEILNCIQRRFTGPSSDIKYVGNDIIADYISMSFCPRTYVKMRRLEHEETAIVMMIFECFLFCSVVFASDVC